MKVKVRKEHECAFCGGIIRIGEMADFESGKSARFDKDDNQIGIRYWKCYLHIGWDKCRDEGYDPESGEFLDMSSVKENN